MNCSAYCGASNSGESWRTAPFLHNLLGLLLDKLKLFRERDRLTQPRAFTFLRVPLVRFLTSASATSRVIPNTANVLIDYLQLGATLRGWMRQHGEFIVLGYALGSISLKGRVMSNQSTESPQVRRNRILGDAIGLSPDEVAEYVTSIQKKDAGDEYTIHFAIQTTDVIRSKVNGLGDALFLDTGPIDFQGLQISKI